MIWVFVYGSNMHLSDLARWFLRERGQRPNILDQRAALLPSHRLVWNYFSRVRGGGAANIERVTGQVTVDKHQLPGVALFVDEPTRLGLDQKEGYPSRYTRTLERIVLLGGEEVDAWVYSVKPEHLHPHYVAPTREYVTLMIQGAQAHGLPKEHVQALRRLLVER